MLRKALQKPEESVRRPNAIDDTWLLSEGDNDQREILAELTPETMAETINAICSEIRQILYGTDPGRWSDVPAISLNQILIDISEGTGLTIWTAGENIQKGQLVYTSTTPDTVFVAHSTDILHLNVIGIANESATAGAQIRIAHSGRELKGLSGIVSGGKYWLQPDGHFGLAISNSNGTFKFRAGYGKNPSTLLIDIGEPKVKP